MSFQAMTWAVDQKLKLREKMVLLMLANHSNGHTGQCNPSLKLLAEECGMSRDSVIRAIKKLQSDGFIKVKKQRVGDTSLPNQYILNLSACFKSPENQFSSLASIKFIIAI